MLTSFDIVKGFMSNALLALNFFLRQNMDQFIWITCKEESANFPSIQTKVSCSLNLCWMAVMASRLSKELHGKVHKFLHLYVHSGEMLLHCIAFNSGFDHFSQFLVASLISSTLSVCFFLVTLFQIGHL